MWGRLSAIPDTFNRIFIIRDTITILRLQTGGDLKKKMREGKNEVLKQTISTNNPVNQICFQGMDDNTVHKPSLYLTYQVLEFE